jgi:nucleotide-binding universal stress UspA family protein
MPYRTLLVSLNDIARADAMIDAAALIATAQDAHVIGCYVVPAVTVYPEVGFVATPALDDTRQQYFKSNLASVKERFDTMLRREGLKGEWRMLTSLYPSTAPMLLDHSRNADLIMVSQIAESLPSNIESDLVERLVMESGRPILMIPQKGNLKKAGAVVVGFNATKEAARALFDSIPMLKGTKDVRVVWVDPYKERSTSGEVPGADAAISLARHSIKATSDSLASGEVNAGEALLRYVDDCGADLLVIGAYAHSRMGEYIFGGATQYVLEHARVPVLMSH